MGISFIHPSGASNLFQESRPSPEQWVSAAWRQLSLCHTCALESFGSEQECIISNKIFFKRNHPAKYTVFRIEVNVFIVSDYHIVILPTVLIQCPWSTPTSVIHAVSDATLLHTPELFFLKPQRYITYIICDDFWAPFFFNVHTL